MQLLPLRKGFCQVMSYSGIQLLMCGVADIRIHCNTAAACRVVITYTNMETEEAVITKKALQNIDDSIFALVRIVQETSREGE